MISNSSDQYQTILSVTNAVYKEKGSKFICYLFPISELSDFEDQISNIKKAHPKARHFCYAYKFNPENVQYRINDDGEPSGTAGKPIFGQLERANIVNVSAVVVRYFGGTKLGASGLIRAYKTAAAFAIDEAVIIKKTTTRDLTIEFDYEKMGILMKCIKDLKLNISSTDYNADARLTLSVAKSELEITITKLKAQLLNRSIEDIVEDDEVEGINFQATS